MRSSSTAAEIFAMAMVVMVVVVGVKVDVVLLTSLLKFRYLQVMLDILNDMWSGVLFILL